MEKLHSYKNGDFTTTIYNDGTKIREGVGIADIPENMDIKITNYCDAGCRWCHEKSTVEGGHCDMDWLLSKLKECCVPGMELAIGGGNPLDHPELIRMLKEVREIGYIPNLTVNGVHEHLITDEVKCLIYGLGISYVPGIVEKIKPQSNVVIHTIAGIHKPEHILNLLNLGHKVLILGYKTYGRGESYYNNKINIKIQELRGFMKNILGKGLVSFDNLAIEQLGIQKHYTKKTRDSKYMGDEGTFTMYIDAVEKEYGIASSLPNRYKLSTIALAFSHIKNEKN